MENQEIITTFWQLLTEVSTVFSAEAKISGEVVVHKPCQAQIIFEERGVSSTGNFYNYWIWQKKEKSTLITLLKKRPNKKEPLFLVQLMPVSASCLEAVAPHLCGKDRYFVKLVLAAKGFMLNWRVTGPYKNQQFSYCYQ